MPAKKKSSKRIRPVIEEVVENPQIEQNQATSETKPDFQKKQIPENAEEKAREFISQTKSSKANQNKTNFKLILFITIITALIVGFVAGGVYVYFSGLSQASEVAATPTSAPVSGRPTPAPTSAITPTPEPVKSSEFSISVLNGSGRIGAAGDLAEIVEGEGYVVDNIGNASAYDFEETVIQLKPGVPAALGSQLENLLSGSYKVMIGQELDENSQYDVVITVGSSAAEE